MMASKDKTLFLIRHAQSMHNAYQIDHPQQKTDPYIFDAGISPEGRRQLIPLKENAKSLQVEVVICSPLTRAMQTCKAAFGDKNVQVIVSPLCTEKLENACDIGRSVAELKADFPNFDFSNVEHDVWWYVPSEFKTVENKYNYQELFRRHHYQESCNKINQNFV